jgi:hypothetical protein
LFSMLGALSGALSTGPVVRTRFQDQLAFVGGPGWPTSVIVNESHTNAFLSDLPFQLSAPRLFIQREWDCREYYLLCGCQKVISSFLVPFSQHRCAPSPA